MDTVRDLVTDLSDRDVELLVRLAGRMALPSGPHEADRWPDRVAGFWHALAAALDEECYRRARQLRGLRDDLGEGGVGRFLGDGGGS